MAAPPAGVVGGTGGVNGVATEAAVAGANDCGCPGAGPCAITGRGIAGARLVDRIRIDWNIDPVAPGWFRLNATYPLTDRNNTSSAFASGTSVSSTVIGAPPNT